MPVLSDKNITHLEQLLQTKQWEIDSLLQLTQAINNNLGADKLFKIYELTLRGQLVEKAVLFFKDEGWKCVCNYGTKKSYEDIDVETKILPFASDANQQKNIEILKEFEILIPVYHKQTPLAFSFISGIKSDSEKSKEEKVKFIQTITNIIAVAVENKRLFKRQLEQEAMKKEMELAAQMQSLLVPGALPKNKNFEMSAVYLPHHEVGGDYYDVICLDEHEIVFCVADISGKGMAAALLMANFQANLRALIQQNIPMAQLIQLLNHKVRDIAKGEKFITLFLARMDLKIKKLMYVNAGHNPPLLYHDGKTKLLEAGSTILGIFDELPFVNVQEIALEKNSFIVNYTDGLTDLEDEQGVHFELERVMDFFKNNFQLSTGDFTKKLVEHITNYKGNTSFPDDITVLCCKIF